MARPTKWDRDIADAVWAKLQEIADANGTVSTKAYIAAIRKDGPLLVEALIEDAKEMQE